MRNSPQHSERADGRGTVPSRLHTSERHTACTSSCQSNYYTFNIHVCIDSGDNDNGSWNTCKIKKLSFHFYLIFLG